MSKKCKYYRESKIEQFTPSCSRVEGGCAVLAVHPEDIDGDFCQYCGGKIKFKEGVAHPDLERDGW